MLHISLFATQNSYLLGTSFMLQVVWRSKTPQKLHLEVPASRSRPESPPYRRQGHTQDPARLSLTTVWCLGHRVLRGQPHLAHYWQRIQHSQGLRGECPDALGPMYVPRDSEGRVWSFQDCEERQLLPQACCPIIFDAPLRVVAQQLDQLPGEDRIKAVSPHYTITYPLAWIPPSWFPLPQDSWQTVGVCVHRQTPV